MRRRGKQPASCKGGRKLVQDVRATAVVTTVQVLLTISLSELAGVVLAWTR